MTKNRPSLASSLHIRTPNQSNIDTKPQQQPLGGMYMNVPIADIDFFEKNPRKHRDEESYAQIKASIRAMGVQHPVHITQRPGSNRYVLAQGGNTRLQIVKELWEETGDKRFASIPCIFVEYVDEQTIHIQHLIENEQRSEMCFWDKALAYAEIRRIFQESTGKKLSLRDCETVFATHGLTISPTLLSWFLFAADKLQALGNLAQYLSNLKTAEIRKTYNDLKKQLKDTIRSEQEFDDWFAVSLKDFAEYSQVQDDLDAVALVAHLQIAFTDKFDIQTADMFEEETSQAKNPPVGDYSGKLNNPAVDTDDTEVKTTSAPQRSSTGSGGGSGSPKTPRIPKAYVYDQPADTAIDDEQVDTSDNDNQPIATRLPENGVAVSDLSPTDTPLRAEQSTAWQSNQNSSGTLNHVVADTVVPEIPADWHSVLHQCTQELLALVHLSNCFVLSNKFPLGFYIEYPDFKQLEHLPLPENYLATAIIDKLHQDAGDIWILLAKISKQEMYMKSGSSIHNNPIIQLPSSSRLLRAFNDEEYATNIEWNYIGDRALLSNKLITWLSNSSDEIGILLQKIFNSLQRITHSGA